MRFVSCFFFFFSSRRRHTRLQGDWSSDVCSSDLFAEESTKTSWWPQRDSNPRLGLERARPWVVIFTNFHAGCHGPCHSKPRSALSGPDPQRSHRGISSEILRRGSTDDH